jgi:hypothetical protein
MPDGVFAYVQNQRGDPQRTASFRAARGWVGNYYNYSERGHPGWYWVETRSNVDLTCYIGNSTVTQNTDDLIFPVGTSPDQAWAGGRYIEYTMPPQVYRVGWG